MVKPSPWNRRPEALSSSIASAGTTVSKPVSVSIFPFWSSVQSDQSLTCLKIGL